MLRANRGHIQGLFMSVLGPKGPEKGAWRFQLIEADAEFRGLINGNYPPMGADQS